MGGLMVSVKQDQSSFLQATKKYSESMLKLVRFMQQIINDPSTKANVKNECQKSLNQVKQTSTQLLSSAKEAFQHRGNKAHKSHKQLGLSARALAKSLGGAVAASKPATDDDDNQTFEKPPIPEMKAAPTRLVLGGRRNVKEEEPVTRGSRQRTRTVTDPKTGQKIMSRAQSTCVGIEIQGMIQDQIRHFESQANGNSGSGSNSNSNSGSGSSGSGSSGGGGDAEVRSTAGRNAGDIKGASMRLGSAVDGLASIARTTEKGNEGGASANVASANVASANVVSGNNAKDSTINQKSQENYINELRQKNDKLTKDLDNVTKMNGRLTDQLNERIAKEEESNRIINQLKQRLQNNNNTNTNASAELEEMRQQLNAALEREKQYKNLLLNIKQQVNNVNFS